MESSPPNVLRLQDAEGFAAQLQDFADRVRGLQHASSQTEFSPELLDRSLAELGNAVEELQVAQDEMHRQRVELREAQADLEHQRQRYKELFDYAPTAYMVTNLVGTILEANGAAATVLQIRREFLVGGSLVTCIERDGRGAFRDALAACASASQADADHVDIPRAWQTRMLRRGRSSGADAKGLPEPVRSFEAELIVSRLPTPLDEPDKLLWLVRDVTAINESQRQLHQSERLAALGQMMATFAHESGNALQRSQAALEMLANRIADRPSAVELLSEAQSAHDHLAHLQKQIKDYASPVRIEKVPCDLGLALERAWQSLHWAQADRQVQFEQQSAARDLHCAIDPAAIQQVFRNVLENSLATCRDPLNIRVAWSEASLQGAPALRVQLHDNGPGMPREVRQRIFEPFFTTRIKGMGLGMAIVKRIVEAHGGLIEVSAAKESGTEVTITLPRGEK